MKYNNPAIEIMKEIERYAMKREKEYKIHGLTFDAAEFIKQVKQTRLTTHMNLRQAFEYVRNKFYRYSSRI
ncbi:hypothetical protein ACP8HI_07170 [Paenibacillus sp. FA6]|uniref:hypothetical protein n=1 Tax=Paenibacillus sp. FA6 TaxID=3413029 RepID=UPI003F659CDC